MKTLASHVKIPKSRIKYDVLLDARGWQFFEFFARPLIVVGKCLEIFHLGEVEATVLWRTKWEMSLAH